MVPMWFAKMGPIMTTLMAQLPPISAPFVLLAGPVHVLAYVQTGVTQVLSTCLIKHTYKQASHRYSVHVLHTYKRASHMYLVHVLSSICTNRRHTGTQYMYYQAYVQTGVTQVPGTCLIKHKYKQASHRYSVLGTCLIKHMYKHASHRYSVHVLSSICTNRRHTGTQYMYYQTYVQTGVT
jgi:hypothetical protein